MDRNQITEFFEVPPDGIGETVVDLGALREAGVLLTVHVKGTSMFMRRSTRAELGMGHDDIRVDHFTAGVSFTIHPELAKAMRSLEGRVRYNLDRFSFDITGFRPKRYLPYTAWEAWLEAHNELVDEWNGYKLEIMRHRAQMVNEMRHRYQEISRRAWAALMAPRQSVWTYEEDQSQPVILPDGASYRNFYDFQRDVTNKALLAVPTEDAIREGLDVSYQVSLITMMSQIREELVTLAEQQARRAEARAEELAARAVHERIADQQAAAHRANEAWGREQERIMRQEADAEIARINMRTRVIEENIREQLRDITNPYLEMFQQLRDQIAADASGVLNSIKAKGQLHPSTSRKARNLVETFRLLNVANDTDLALLISQLEARLDERRPGVPHNIPQLQRTLEEITEMCSDEAMRIRRAQQSEMQLPELPEGAGPSAARNASSTPDLDLADVPARGPRHSDAPDLTQGDQ